MMLANGATVPQHDAQTDAYFVSDGLTHGTADAPAPNSVPAATIGGYVVNVDGSLSAPALRTTAATATASAAVDAGPNGGITPNSGLSAPKILTPAQKAANAATTTTIATDPFSQLTNLLSGLASAGAGTTGLPSTDTASTVTPTTGSPSMVVPLILLLLAGVAGWYWWKQQHHHAKAAAA